MKKYYDAKGFGAVELILVILVLGLLGASGWYIVTKNQDKTGNSPVSTAQSNTAGKDTQNPQQEAKTVTLQSMGIKFTPSSDLGTLLVKENVNNENMKYAVFSNVELTKLKDADGTNLCNGDGSATNPPMHLGTLFKVDGTYPANPTDENTSGVLVKQFNGYNLQFRVPQESCFKNEQNQDRASALSQELINSLKSTAQEIK